jgi:5-formyltetrahydrofolate cyclo-ligase
MTPTKPDLRRELRERVAGLPPRAKRQESDRLCDQLIGDRRLAQCRVIGVYLALPDEPDLSRALQTFLDRGQQLALPFLEEDGSWVFRGIESLDGPETGPFGLRLPEAGPVLELNLLDAVLVPGRGFTTAGDRIGRGKGIYDRLLKGIRARTVGIAFRCQMVPHLPREPHDIRLDEVLTTN